MTTPNDHAQLSAKLILTPPDQPTSRRPWVRWHTSARHKYYVNNNNNNITLFKQDKKPFQSISLLSVRVLDNNLKAN